MRKLQQAAASNLFFFSRPIKLWSNAKAMNNHKEAVLWFNKALTSFQDLGLKERVKIIENQLRKLESQGNKVTEAVCNEEAVQ